MSENGGSHNGVDSDTSQNGEEKLCRDFVRNVCNRGKNCKFIHPENVKIRTDPIFCHDYQQNKCFRSTCKFIHCTREDEEHYKQTGELPEGAVGTEYYESKPRRQTGGKGVISSNGAGRKSNRGTQSVTRPVGRNGFGRATNNGKSEEEIPICKDSLKGICDRPPGGCKFRHINPAENYVAGQNRRRVGSQSYYDAVPESKRNHYSTDYDDYGSTGSYTPPPPPPPPQSNYSTPFSIYHDTGSHIHGGSVIHHSSPSNIYNSGAGRNGLITQGTPMNDINAITTFSSNQIPSSNSAAAAMKALEDENFMLKRRIEELKKQVSDLVATNEYLLSQNAHLRINNMNITKEVQVQGVSAGGPAGSVVQTLVSMSQPIGINSTLSGSAAQPLSTITSLPTVSITPVSMSQPLPVVSMAQHSQAQTVYPLPLVTTQGGLPLTN